MPGVRKLLHPELKKEERELLLVEQFFDQFPHNNEVAGIGNADPPSPDTLITWNDGEVTAIEVTNLIDDSPSEPFSARARKDVYNSQFLGIVGLRDFFGRLGLISLTEGVQDDGQAM